MKDFQGIFQLNKKQMSGIEMPRHSFSYWDENIRVSISKKDQQIGWIDYEEKTFLLLFNGEITNKSDLNSRLNLHKLYNDANESKIILHAFLKWGVQCLRYISGRYCFVLWEKNDNKIYCGRDCFGSYPFYYSVNAEAFLFSSDLKDLLQFTNVNKKIDKKAVFSFLQMENISNSITFFKGIKRLPAFCLMTLSFENNVLNCKLNKTKFDSKERRYKVSQVKPLKDLLERSTIDLMGKHKIASLLSGGIDSSAVTMLAEKNKTNKGALKTFSFVYPDFSHELKKKM